MNDNPRVILTLAAEADDKFIWDQLQTLQLEMFGAGPDWLRVWVLHHNK